MRVNDTFDKHFDTQSSEFALQIRLLFRFLNLNRTQLNSCGVLFEDWNFRKYPEGLNILIFHETACSTGCVFVTVQQRSIFCISI